MRVQKKLIFRIFIKSSTHNYLNQIAVKIKRSIVRSKKISKVASVENFNIPDKRVEMLIPAAESQRTWAEPGA